MSVISTEFVSIFLFLLISKKYNIPKKILIFLLKGNKNNDILNRS